MMNDLIKITTNENDEQLVSGRELHKFLSSDENFDGTNSEFNKWINRQIDYLELTENEDYSVVKIGKNDNHAVHEGYVPLSERKKLVDYAFTIDRAKEISMIQRTEKGKQARLYFIQAEKAWNSEEMILLRSRQILERKLETLQIENSQLSEQKSIAEQRVNELQPKASYYDYVLQTKGLVSVSIIAKQYGKSAVWLNKLLHEYGVIFKQGNVWLLYQKYADKGYTKTNFAPDDVAQLHPHTKWTQQGMLFIYELLKSKGILPMVERDGQAS